MVPGVGVVSGCVGNGNLSKDMRYSVPLTRYEMLSYGCDGDHDHMLCHKCYANLRNRSRFGLCNDCFNDQSEMKTLMAVDAKRAPYVYLTRRGRRVSFTGGLIKIPIFAGTKIVSHKMMMYVPYVFADRPFKRRDFDLQLSNERTLKLKCHGIMPAEYLLAELD